jgi:hypothetical protein
MKEKSHSKIISVNGRARFYNNFDEISKQVLFDLKVSQLAENTGLDSHCEF